VPAGVAGEGAGALLAGAITGALPLGEVARRLAARDLAYAAPVVPAGAQVIELDPDRTDPEAILGALGALWVHGASVDWKAVFPAGGRRVALPTYPFQRERHWIEPALAGAPREQQPARPVVQRPEAVRAPERPAGVLELVRDEVAAVLGIPDPSALSSERPLAELGLDSRMALELRNRLAAATGLRLPATLFFEFPTIDQAAHRLLDQLDRDAAAAPPATPAPGAPLADGEAALVSKFLQLWQLGERELAYELLHLSARIRHGREARSGSPPRATSASPVQLAHGTGAQASLLCLPPILPGASTRIAYASLASCLDGRRAVWGLSNPGQGAGERLPIDRAAVVAGYVERVQEAAAGGPFALVGLSSGGWLAHALTHHLEGIGLSPTALVLIDTYRMDELTPGLTSVLLDGWLTRVLRVLPTTDDDFTSHRWYAGLFADWTPTPIAAPTLFLRAMEPVPGLEHERTTRGGDWRPSWSQPHTLVEVPGHHFTVLTEHASSTAQIIHDWLAARSGADRE
jgi:thioesterase domain-containing protein/acyl carrier protein